MRELAPILRPSRGGLASVYLLAVSIAATSGCDRGNPTAPAARLGAETSSSEPRNHTAAALRPIDADEGQRFAEAFESAVYRSDPSVVTRMIDWETLFRTATDGIAGSEGFRESFIQGALSKQGELAIQLSQAVADGGSFHLLRFYSEKDERRALFRLLQPGSGVKYQELILGRDAAGEVRAVDIYIFLSGERLSHTMRRMYLLAAAEQPGRPLDNIISPENEFIKHTAEFQQMASHLRGGNPQQTVEIYQTLPASMQQEKTVMLLYVQAASSIGDDLYAQAIDDFRAVHARDACVDMVSIDGHLLRKEYDRALEAIARVDTAVGGDPYMNVLRANINLMRGEYAVAESFAKMAIDQEPGLVDPYWTLVMVSLFQRSFADTAKWLTVMHEKFRIEFEDLQTIPDYAEFVKSSEYEAWQATLAKVER
jgi:hypothetical protein